MTMKHILLILLIALSFEFNSYAQDYKTGIGIRSGWGTGLSVKHFLDKKTALEGIFDTRWKGVAAGLLYEIHQNAFNTDLLKWYYGAGGHIGFWDSKNVSWGNNTGNYSVVGVDGILGLEYNFEEIPISISIDWKPALNISGYSGFWGDGGGISIRYTF